MEVVVTGIVVVEEMVDVLVMIFVVDEVTVVEAAMGVSVMVFVVVVYEVCIEDQLQVFSGGGFALSSPG